MHWLCIGTGLNDEFVIFTPNLKKQSDRAKNHTTQPGLLTWYCFESTLLPF